jgi:hypothetical protein
MRDFSIPVCYPLRTISIAATSDASSADLRAMLGKDDRLVLSDIFNINRRDSDDRDPVTLTSDGIQKLSRDFDAVLTKHVSEVHLI